MRQEGPSWMKLRAGSSPAQARIYLALLFFSIAGMNLYDILHTIELCSHFPWIKEGNPLMNYLLHWDPRWAIVAKMTAVCLFILIMGVYSTAHLHRSLAITAAVALVYVLLTGWHVLGMRLSLWYGGLFP